MILDLLIQFAADLARAIMVDALSGRIRGRVSAFRRFRKIHGATDVVSKVHWRNRDRLLHRLRTEEKEDV
jgi:hypothetical protein